MNAAAAASFPYSGPAELRAPIEAALQRVVDPEMAMSVLDVGLVLGVTIDDDKALVLITMTSAACPVSDVIVEDVESELDATLPAGLKIQVELVWDPPWSPERMSARAKAFMGW